MLLRRRLKRSWLGLTRPRTVVAALANPASRASAKSRSPQSTLRPYGNAKCRQGTPNWLRSRAPLPANSFSASAGGRELNSWMRDRVRADLHPRVVAKCSQHVPGDGMGITQPGSICVVLAAEIEIRLIEIALVPSRGDLGKPPALLLARADIDLASVEQNAVSLAQDGLQAGPGQDVGAVRNAGRHVNGDRDAEAAEQRYDMLEGVDIAVVDREVYETTRPLPAAQPVDQSLDGDDLPAVFDQVTQEAREVVQIQIEIPVGQRGPLRRPGGTMEREHARVCRVRRGGSRPVQQQAHFRNPQAIQRMSSVGLAPALAREAHGSHSAPSAVRRRRCSCSETSCPGSPPRTRQGRSRIGCDPCPG